MAKLEELHMRITLAVAMHIFYLAAAQVRTFCLPWRCNIMKKKVRQSLVMVTRSNKHWYNVLAMS